MGIYSTALASLRNVARRIVGTSNPGTNSPALPPTGTQHYPINTSGKKPQVQIVNDWIVPSTIGWDLDSLQAAILQLENGNLFAAHSLMLAMTRDATVAHGLMVRRMSLSALPWRIDFPPSIPEEARDALLKHWPEAITPQDLATASGYTVMLGLAPATQQWFLKTEPDGKTYWQFRTEILETGHCQYRPDMRNYWFISRGGYTEITDDGNAWALFKSLGDRRHHLDCAVRTLAVLWFIIQEAIRYHRAYNAEYGRPIKALSVPDQHRLSEDVANLVAQASGLYGGSVIILPQFAESQQTANFDLKLVEAKSRGFQTFADLAKTCRDLITLYLIGVLETTGGSSASNAKAQTQLRVADRYTTADARIREDAINRILKCWADFNGFADAPRYVVDTEPPADEAHRAAVAKDRAAAIKATAEALKAMSDWVTIDEPRVITMMKEIGVDFETQRPQALNPYVAAGSPAAMERASDSVMVCWAVPPELARVLAVPGGEAPEELHLTLALCRGGLPDVLAAMVAVVPTLTAVDGFVQGVASWPVGGGLRAEGEVEGGEDGEPLTLPVSTPRSRSRSQAVRGESVVGQVAPASADGSAEPDDAIPQGSLNEQTPKSHKLNIQRSGRSLATPDQARTDEGQVAYVSLVDAPALADMRARIIKSLTAIGVDVQDNHGFIPHITRAYLPAGASIASPPDSYPIHIGELSVWALGGRIRVPMGLPDEEEQAINELSDESFGSMMVQLSADIDVLELRSYQRDARGRFGHGGGLGSAAKSHSETAHKQNSVEAHRKAARANVAVARTALKRGDVQKAKEHLEAAKTHQNKVKEIKAAPKTEPVAAPAASKVAPVAAKPTSKPAPAPASKPVPTVATEPKNLNPTALGKAESTQKWVKDLSQDERAGLHSYASADFQQINGGLRKERGNVDKLATTELHYNEGSVANAAKHIDSAIAKSPGLPADTFLYRKFKSNPAIDPASWSVGGTFQDHGYVSTNVGAPVGGYSSANVSLKIVAPKGTKGAFLSKSTLADSGSQEYLLPRGSKFRVDKIKKDRRGGYEVQVTVVNHEG